jgi:hypothetical protein
MNLSDAGARAILQRAYERLQDAVDNSTPPLIDPDTLRRAEG